MKMLNAFYIFLVGSGIGATFLPQGQVVYAYDDLKVRSTQVDGFPRIDVYSPHNKTKPAFSRYKDGQFLVSATIWKIPGSPDVGLRFIFVVGAGPSQQLVIAGPNRDGHWVTLLDAFAANAYSMPPETVDLRGTGIADLITMDERIHNIDRDLPGARCSIWRWNSVAQKYLLAYRSRYRDRLGPRKNTKPRNHSSTREK